MARAWLESQPVRLALGLALVATVLSLSACGGGSRSASSSASGPAVPDSKASAIGDAQGEIISAANQERYVVGNRQNVRRAQQLIKPLTIADTLQVRPSDPTACGLVGN